MRNYIEHFSILSRRNKIALQIVLDSMLLAISFLGAMLLRLESLDFAGQPGIWGALLSSIMATLLAFWGLGLYRVVVRFITGRVLIIIGKGAVVAAISLFAAGLVFDASIPRSVPIIFAVFAFLSVGGLRFAARTYFRNPNHLNKRPVIIYGAGEAGLQLLNALFHGQEFAPVALVDDDPSLQNLGIGGLRVYSPDRIPRLVHETGARVILLAIPSLGRVRRREIVSALEDLQLEIKTIPGMSDIISGKAKISELRTVSAEDLLGRDPVAPDTELLGRNITGRVVMVSGAGGSIGSELCRQILTQNPSVLVLYDVSEFALYAIEAELSATAVRLLHQTKVVPILGSVQHSRRLEAAIKGFKVQTIYHAAAYKHVPLVEENVVEGIRNNVFGTLAITLAAQKLGVENFILISTDKAVRPTNVMGATKRIAELICQAHAQEASSTVFSMVRFGNVLGSSGSVIPRFRAQIEAGGPVTVTHKDINRYFMTIPEAAQLVIQAGALGQGGDVFVLDMGDPVKIMDLAFSMVKLHGLIPYMVDHPDQVLPEKGDIPVCVTGLRKGEKLFEELLIGNNPAPTKHPRIMTASEVSLPRDALMAVLDRLLQACEAFDLPAIVIILHELPLEYAPSSTEISDLLWRADHDTDEQQSMAIEAGIRT
ncbi:MULTISPECIES: polysaccharide biosynthesis protein [Roseobacteraceae]|uniref:UDP-N-acetyl-alpha-D-glucosamine C6 dehydratase n=3 Tax=Roseobacteraceae TaxID=2854170 RepID=A0A0U1NPD1_9RHOB|nr:MULTISPECIES: nucleoside-diphosphate sugar epimerase/dehydratase [Roseobacteraceae]CRK76339.1 UDP-N-acetyl-alpha-D-glucosamine C6 dehydratase [Nereida ignava]CUH61454.1 UDP-N-acetyl-alpha-D-glucosamine C6 dehydratase [Thalassobacter stenotrophicus]SFJ79593.1 NDP-sugar epimerase, includes UDP-GlcNAc-inverting 4,6-dehydratase FlaA1 and capsular polysaccharide biosynthesis protein EpsC [Nereida ignava DSM 16309]SHJ09428.1 NDP-sugar epimerase, includes UDP-GlcNAc-inverting 4,6-dehydratase FlaA1 